ncbi:MAG: hypothetical protein HOM11_02980 [Methylococcales bacterium]|jgi:hypothetical protein|nr:hypothetical protein [Methylococcales bacterium]MBT7442684.1 hypothetical protein [Methylococcales bacterium]
MSTKAELIKQMQEMQAKFGDHVKGGIDIEEYYGDDGFMKEHIDAYSKLADQVNKMAHEEVGSHA